MTKSSLFVCHVTRVVLDGGRNDDDHDEWQCCGLTWSRDASMGPPDISEELVDAGSS